MKIKATMTNNKIIGFEVMKFKIAVADWINHVKTSVAIPRMPVIDEVAAFSM